MTSWIPVGVPFLREWGKQTRGERDEC